MTVKKKPAYKVVHYDKNGKRIKNLSKVKVKLPEEDERYLLNLLGFNREGVQ